MNADFFQHSAALFATLDLQGRFLQYNETWASLLHSETLNFSGSSLSALLLPEDEPVFRQIWQQLPEQQLQTLRACLQDKNTDIHPVFWQLHWLEAEQCVYVTGIPETVEQDCSNLAISTAVKPCDIEPCTTPGKQLWQMPDLMEMMFNQISAGIILLNAQGKIICLNPVFLDIFGYTKESDLLGRQLLSLFPDYLYGQVRQAWYELVKDQQSFPRNWVMQHHYQGLFEAEIEVSYLQHQGANIILMLFRDVTIYKQTLRLAQENESRMQLVLSNLPIMVDALDENGVFVLWNLECERVTGYTADEILDNPDALRLLYPNPDLRDKMKGALHRVMESEPGYYQGQWLTHCKDGSYKTISWAVNSAIRIPGFAVWGIGEDLTEQKQAQRQLKENEQRLSKAVDKLPIMVDALDEKGNIVLWNKECERVTGYAAIEMLNNPQALHWLYPDASYRENMKTAVKKVLDTDPGYRRGEWKTHCKDGSVKLIAWAVNSEIKFPGYAVWGIGEDVTQRDQAIYQLQENETRLRLLVENMPIMLMAFNQKQDIVMWNRQCENITGYAAEQILENPNALAHLYPQIEYRFYREDPLHYNIGESWEMELVCSDGKHRTIKWSDASRHITISGWAKWIVGEDITDKKQKQLAVKENLSLLSMALGNVESGVCITDSRQNIVYINQHYAQLHGYSTDELLDTALKTIMPVDSHGFVYRHYFSFINGAHGNFYHEKQRCLHRDGHFFELELDVHRFAHDQRQQSYVIWLSRCSSNKKSRKK
ncbi:PAS domain-containing protein [Candidatus Venteria ishoeyi]|uniref:PAS domain-containing protein n=1 Tax=Candidatus Venteria ishoeyi TaxID=1899563 RepID=UPI0025A5D23F|nr:PAS domain-containing protein [Candidatus Venteria ishoeyi]MDM8546365.1 PAS domain-containing protein [Candidatus Venteria ishoeyi]